MPRTHEKVSDPRRSTEPALEPGACLGPQGSAARVRATLATLSGRWKLDVLFQLFARPVLRFSELERAIPGISRKMLTVRLRELEKDGVVVRVVHPEVPPRVDYALTPAGAALRPALVLLRDWGAR